MGRIPTRDKQTNWLPDILSLGKRLWDLGDRESIAQHTVETLSSSLGFDQVALYLAEARDSASAQIVAKTHSWQGLEYRGQTPSGGQTPSDRPGHAPRFLTDAEYQACRLIPAPGTEAQLTAPTSPVHWHEHDLVYAPIRHEDGLLGYVLMAAPNNGLRPTQDALYAIEIMAGQAALALQSVELYMNADQTLDERLAELRLAELATLQEIDRQINAKLDLSHVLETTLDWAMHATLASAGTISLLEETPVPSPADACSKPDVGTPSNGARAKQALAQRQQALRVIAHRGYAIEMAGNWDASWPVDQGVAESVVRTGETTVIDGVTQDAPQECDLSAPRSHLATPIKRDTQVIGVIGLESTVPGGFTADHLGFLTRLADRAAIAIENAQLYEQTNQRIAELESLHEISLDLTSNLHLEAVLDSIATHARALVQADHVAIYLYDQREKKLSYGTGLSGQGTETNPPVSLEENQLTVTVAHTGQPAIIHSAQGHPLLPEAQRQIGAIASMPLLKSGHVLGVFDLSFREPHAFAQDELRVLNVLADQAAIAIENAQLYVHAQHAREAKKEFVELVSQELKTPMTSIHGYARLMAMRTAGPITEQQQAFLDVIQENVWRMVELVNSLTDLSSIESEGTPPKASPVDLTVSIERALPIVRHRHRAHPHPIAVDIPEELPKVLVDLDRLTQVWVNLLGAAHRYTLDGEPIRVWARGEDEQSTSRIGMRGHPPDAGDYILCAVEHAGIALAPEEQESVFEPFHGLQNADARPEARDSERGTGLELAAARSIVELYGGHIWVESEQGMGNTFYFCVPTRSS